MSDENQDQNQDQEQEQQTDTTTTQETSESTNNENDPYLKAREEVEALYGEALRDSQREQLKVARELAELRGKMLERETPEQNPITGTDFLTDPHTHISNVVRSELEKSLAPFNEFIHSTRVNNKFAQLKAKFRSHPSLGPIYAQVESEVDQMLGSINPNELTETTFQASILSAYGMLQAGFIKRPTNQQEKPVTTLPSNPPNPNKRKVEGKPSIQLTESQLRIAKLNGQTPEEYLAYLESDGTISDLNNTHAKFKSDKSD